MCCASGSTAHGLRRCADPQPEHFLYGFNYFEAWEGTGLDRGEKQLRSKRPAVRQVMVSGFLRLPSAPKLDTSLVIANIAPSKLPRGFLAHQRRDKLQTGSRRPISPCEAPEAASLLVWSYLKANVTQAGEAMIYCRISVSNRNRQNSVLISLVRQHLHRYKNSIIVSRTSILWNYTFVQSLPKFGSRQVH